MLCSDLSLIQITDITIYKYYKYSIYNILYIYIIYIYDINTKILYAEYVLPNPMVKGAAEFPRLDRHFEEEALWHWMALV